MDWTAVGTFVAGLLGGYTIKAVIDNRSNKIAGRQSATASNGSVAQSGNVAGGSISGRDVNTK